MRKVLYGAASSLDGFIARPDGAVDWLLWSDDVAAITAKYWKSIDTVVMGRKTYEVAAASGSARYPGKSTYVYSRTLEPREEDGLIVRSDDAAEDVFRLKREAGAGICVMGGGELARALFAEGLIDEVGVNAHPILLGAGIPMFPRLPAQVGLRLLSLRPLAHGCVSALYAVDAETV